MAFDPSKYGLAVESILALDGAGQRLMPLAVLLCSSEEARTRLEATSAQELFPNSFSPQGAFSGLWLYFSCFDESHGISQDLNTVEGSFWHGILHRQEPDAGNADYWFRKVGPHPVFPALLSSAHELGKFLGLEQWDPFAFIEFCEAARARPGTADETLAREIQRSEWQLLFDYCARPRSTQ